jgi:hypothetical protein
MLTLVLIGSIPFGILVNGSLKMSAPPPDVNYSWEETTFSESRVLQWTDDSFVINDSGSYSDVYETDAFKYNVSEGYVIKEMHTIYFDANFSSECNVTTSGNATINMNIDVIQVELDYAQKVDFLWFAAKNGTLEYEYYLSRKTEDISYYEENHRYIETTYEKYNLSTWELIDTWNDTNEIYDVINTTHRIHKEWYPFFEHLYYTSEFIRPMFLTVQIFTTQKNDKIAWANLFHNFLIYEDEDQNGILSVGNVPVLSGPPNIATSTEWRGVMDAVAENQYYEVETNETVFPSFGETSPVDVPFADIVSSIAFSPPTEISETEISWDIEYPDFPLDIQISDPDIPWDEEYTTPQNALYNEMSPTNLSYGFDFILNETQADFDITWGIGKLTNDTAYNALQGYGLVIPQYNFFLSSFDIDEVSQAQLSVPRDKFIFESNDTLVAEINMGKPEKQNYTLFDFPSSGIDSEFLSPGGSVHKSAVGFANENSYYDNPFICALFSLDDIVAAKSSFTVVDNLFSMETQNYPLWNGEKLIHDPSLTIYFALDDTVDDPPPDDPPPLGDIPGAIPSFNLPFLIGIVSTVMTLIAVKFRRKLKI